MNMSWNHTQAENETPQPPGLFAFLVFAVALHLVLFFFGLLFGGIYGVPGPGGGDALIFQLAAGDAHDRFAAPKAVDVKPKPAVEKPKVKPKPKPKPKLEVAPRKAKDEKPRPVVEEPKEEPEPELTLEEELAGMGVAGGKGQGARGQAIETILNKKGNSLTGAMIATQMSGRTFKLNVMGRDDIQGTNNAINTVIKLHPDGTTEVTLTHFYRQTYHNLYSSTRSESASGRWWIEGNRWCHQSQAINYNTKDCYDLTTDGPTLRLYYAPCSIESSALCKSGRRAAIGAVE
ncbi:MAG: hypothetical protein Q7S99_03400 [Parvibaculum sp.]|nr:hypothetical protein [Parvibaculum sp.]